MGKIILYTAISLDGKIARSNGDVSWLEDIPNPDKTDYGYKKFYNSIDTTIMGNNTYQKILELGVDFPYTDKDNYVLTNNKKLKKNTNVNFLSENIVAFIKNLKNRKGKNIWLVGGGQVNTLLLSNGLIDEILLFIMPFVLIEGIELFENVQKKIKFELVKSEEFSSGVVGLHYKVLTQMASY